MNIKKESENHYHNSTILVFFFIGLFTIISQPIICSGEEIIVSKRKDGDYKSIEDAINAAMPGDTILIKKGIYREQVNVRVSGTEKNYITVTAYGNGPVIIDGRKKHKYCLYIHSQHFLKFSDITLRKASSAGVEVFNSSNIIFDNITSSKHFNRSRGAGIGMDFDGSEGANRNISITNCHIANNTGHGIWLYHQNYDFIISSNLLEYNGLVKKKWKRKKKINYDKNWGHNIKVALFEPDDSSLGSKRITITDNELHHAAAQGILSWNAEYLLIKNNNIHHNGATGIQIEDGTKYFVVEDNTCSWNQQQGSTEAGIWVDDAAHGIVRNNTLSHNQAGIIVSKSNAIIVRHNLIYSNQRENESQNYNCGIELAAYEDIKNQSIRLVHNTIHEIGNSEYDENAGLLFSGDDTSSPITQDIIIFNNIFSETVSGYDVQIEHILANLSYKSNYNTFYNSSGPKALINKEAMSWDDYIERMGQDINSLNVNPKFVDTSENDFQLQPHSPCIEKGRNMTQTTSKGRGTNVPVEDALFFTDGFNVSKGDMVVIGSNKQVEVLEVDYDRNILTVSETIEWQTDDGVTFPYVGIAPDIGAFESKTSLTTKIHITQK